jgi:Na+/H+-dicarboxylate symporter
VVGIAKMGDTRTVGRIGVKTLGWFMLASLMSLTLGLVMVHLMQPGWGSPPCPMTAPAPAWLPPPSPSRIS